MPWISSRSTSGSGWPEPKGSRSALGTSSRGVDWTGPVGSAGGEPSSTAEAALVSGVAAGSAPEAGSGPASESTACPAPDPESDAEPESESVSGALPS